MKISDRLGQMGTISLLFLAINRPTIAQVIPDDTLPSNTMVTPNGSTFRIEGGTTAGDNLFHSFREFSIGTGQEAYFNNAVDIQNIVTRVTGGKLSNIDGLIRANGSANLFLINPNGIVFGAGASLNIGGSFIGSSARSIKFADGSIYSATNPNAPPLLKINVPIGLQFGPNSGTIQVRGTGNNLEFDPDTLATVRDKRPVGLQVNPGRTLAIVGGDVTLVGGNITAEAGRIELGSVAEGTVTLTPINSGWMLGYENIDNFQDIRLSKAASASSSGNGGGSIQVQGRRISLLEGSAILADTLGNANGEGLIVRASESVEMIADRALFASSFFSSVDPGASGNGGNLTVETGRLLMRDGAIIGADTFGSGNAGALTIRANSVEMLTATLLATSVYAGATGNGGNLTIETGRLWVTNGAQILTFTLGGGKAGNVSVLADDIAVTGASESGRLSVLAASTEEGATGSGGKLAIATSSLLIADGARVGASSFGLGNAGELTVKADRVEVRGRASDGRPSLMSADTSGDGKGGNLTIETAQLTVSNGGQISAGTFGKGEGGNLVVRATDSIELNGAIPAVPTRGRSFFQDDSGQLFPSGLFASSAGVGRAGTLTIDAGKLQVSDRAQVSVSSQQTGEAGNLSIAARQLLLDRGILSAATVDGNQGNISLISRDIQLRRGSAIATNASGTATGGNIAIATDTLVALENSDISANASESRGGGVTINSLGVFGTKFRLNQTSASDITATGGTPDLIGTVQISTPDVNPASGLVELPEEVRDISNQIVSGCEVNKGNRFVVTGRGGLPSNPTQMLQGRTLWRDLRPLKTGDWESIFQSLIPHSQFPIIEATEMAIAPNGKVTLVAKASDVTPSNLWYQPTRCSH